MRPTCPITYVLTAFNNANHDHFDLIPDFFPDGHKAELKGTKKEMLKVAKRTPVSGQFIYHVQLN